MAVRAFDSFFGRFRAQADPAYWIPRSKGFRVESSDGEMGTVAAVRFAPDSLQPSELAVRGRAVGSGQIVLIGVDEVVRVIPAERRLIVRGTAVPVRFRLLASTAFAATAASFLLPFLTITLERSAAATGIDLVTGNPSFSGSYVHASYVGDVELLASHGHVPALVTFALAIIGVFGVWLPGKKTVSPGLVAGVAGLIGMWALWMTTTGGSQIFASTSYHYGFWLTIALFFWSAAASLFGRRLLRSGD